MGKSKIKKAKTFNRSILSFCFLAYVRKYGQLHNPRDAHLPMRVMIRMLAATYAESVISMPILLSGEDRGPMLKGTTYMVRPDWSEVNGQLAIQPFMQPLNSLSSSFFFCSLSTQLLVGPESFWTDIR